MWSFGEDGGQWENLKVGVCFLVWCKVFLKTRRLLNFSLTKKI